jgi:signal transduction histidine kinase
LKKSDLTSDKYIQELEDKIIDLGLRLKSKTNELNNIRETNKKTLGKLVHNLKNPVGVIYSFSDMILDSVEDYSPDKLEKYLGIINSSANFSIQLLNSIAKFSQFQSSDFTLSLKKVNYQDIVKSVIKDCNKISEEKNISIDCVLPDEAIFLNIDESEFRIALNNILNNAIRYSESNTVIKIIVKNNLNTIETIIEDKGIGINKDDLPLIFNDFFVVNTYSENKQKCIGLGLTIANEIVKLHQGNIHVKSSINNGTEVTINLPK